jgi:hypothetical protein
VGKLKLLKEIEEAEYRYFTSIKTQMLSRINSILKFLNSRIDIIADWREQFLETSRSGYRQSDLDRGAERVFHNWASLFFSTPNSTPIGADLVFDSDEGFRIHIDVKTALVENPSDYKDVINIGKNQTSYSIGDKFKGSLPTRYSDGKITLTYTVQVIHEHFSDKIHALVLACVPNGNLNEVYGGKIMKAGKGGWKKAKDFRFRYKSEGGVLKFELIDGKPPRVEIISALENSNIAQTLGLNINHRHHL